MLYQRLFLMRDLQLVWQITVDLTSLIRRDMQAAGLLQLSHTQTLSLVVIPVQSVTKPDKKKTVLSCSSSRAVATKLTLDTFTCNLIFHS